MGVSNIARSAAAAGLCAALAAPVAAQEPPREPQRVTVAFSDPGRPGSLELDIVRGDIVIRGTDRRDVLIEARAAGSGPRPRREEPPPPGLRRLTQSGSFSVEEDANEITVEVDSPIQAFDFVIEVPSRTNLSIDTVTGTVAVEGVEGDLEVESVNGPIALTNVSGSVVASSVNGQVVATIVRTTPEKPMAFTTLNGSVDVTLPAAVKADLTLRSEQGDVYTDFDLQARPGRGPAVDDRRPEGGQYRVEVDNAIRGSVNGGGPEFEMRTFNGNIYVRKGR